MELKQRPRIGVMGPSVCTPELQELARRVGAELAQAGAILICGGGGGVMEAAARGMREGGGLTIGILPGPDSSAANPYVDIPIVTDLGNARNVINVLTSHAVIAVGGAAGTLSEIALALKCGVPVVGLRTWRLTPPDGLQQPTILMAETPQEAVAAALALGRSRSAAERERARSL